MIKACNTQHILYIKTIPILITVCIQTETINQQKRWRQKFKSLLPSFFSKERDGSIFMNLRNMASVFYPSTKQLSTELTLAHNLAESNVASEQTHHSGKLSIVTIQPNEEAKLYTGALIAKSDFEQGKLVFENHCLQAIFGMVQVEVFLFIYFLYCLQ